METYSVQELTNLQAADIQKLRDGELPDDLIPLKFKWMRIRGFLYPSKRGGVVLAAEPDLKSCCAGSQPMLHRQIALQNFSGQISPGRAQLVEGVFVVGAVKDVNEELLYLYALEDAIVVPESGNQGLFLACALAAITGAVIFVWRRIRIILN